ncbi:MAG: hypothetical protein ABIP99_14950 [Ilumatobacteraceae bacterium]
MNQPPEPAPRPTPEPVENNRASRDGLAAVAALLLAAGLIAMVITHFV